MPRPDGGYKNRADQPVPGVHDITKRYKDSAALIHWAHKEGLKGNTDLYARTADIGTAVHRMAELDLRGEPEREVNAVPYGLLHRPDDIDKAIQAFRQFQAWRKVHDIRAIAFEKSLVSERFQYGGTFDVIAWVDGVRSLIDFKTSKTAGAVYLEMRLAMAAHGNLWHEQNPNLPLQAYHLITLPKDGSPFGHHAFASLDAEWEMFRLQLDCWRIEKGLSKKRTVAENGQKRPETVAAETPAPVRKRATKPATVAPAPKLRLAEPVVEAPRFVPLPSYDGLSMAEILRMHGNVREEAVRC